MNINRFKALLGQSVNTSMGLDSIALSHLRAQLKAGLIELRFQATRNGNVDFWVEVNAKRNAHGTWEGATTASGGFETTYVVSNADAEEYFTGLALTIDHAFRSGDSQ